MAKRIVRRATLCLLLWLLLPPMLVQAQAIGVSGQIRYHSSGAPVSGVSVELHGASPAAVQTDPDGRFAVSGLSQGDWRIEPRKLGGLNNAITALDAVFALQTKVGLQTPGAVQALACDVSGDGAITALDAALILQQRVGLIARFPAARACGSDWVFVPVAHPVANQNVIPPLVGPESCRPAAIEFNPLVSLADGQDFLAVLFGDCASSWTPAGTASPTPTAAPTPTPTAAAADGCPFSFSDDVLASGLLCRHVGAFNPDPGCSEQLTVFWSGDSNFILAVTDTDPLYTFAADVESPTSATLIALFVGQESDPIAIDGVVELRDDRATLVIDPSTAPFSLQGCSFERYIGAFIEALQG